MIVIIGLGNYESKYQLTRHNVGFRVIDRLAAQLNLEPQADKYLSAATAKNDELILLKPLTYVNESGDSARAVIDRTGISEESIWVIHDDVEIPFGEVRVKFAGSSGGHNGIKSIDQAIGSGYWRVRIGVGRNDEFRELSDYVLAPFTSEEESELGNIIDQTVSYLIQSIDEKEIKPITFNATKEHQTNNK